MASVFFVVISLHLCRCLRNADRSRKLFDLIMSGSQYDVACVLDADNERALASHCEHVSRPRRSHDAHTTLGERLRRWNRKSSNRAS